jgi:hypothetical protein
MELFLTNATWDLIFFVIACYLNDLMLMGVGFATAYIIYTKAAIWNDFVTTGNVLPPRYGWKAMLFGIIMGSINFLAGSVTKTI